MIEPVLEMRDVVKFYAGDKPVLNGVSFRIFQGETKIIIGASGSGKSTILKLIMGLDKPDEGHIFVQGRDIIDMDEDETCLVCGRKIGMVFRNQHSSILCQYAKTWHIGSTR
jgi:phospholipid/cholesterol/gamma-HCH transport system ATP-binding protein